MPGGLCERLRPQAEGGLSAAIAAIALTPEARETPADLLNRARTLASEQPDVLESRLLVARDAGDGLGDLPYPPSFPKMPGEPPRVQPSRMVPEHWGLDPR